MLGLLEFSNMSQAVVLNGLPEINKDCEVNLVIGALSELTKADYQALKDEFYGCPELFEATMKIDDFDFNLDEN